MRTRRVVTVLSLLAFPAIGYAQQTLADSAPHAGTWGAEVFIGSGGTGPSVLRFLSPRFVLLFGADFSVAHSKQDDLTGGTFSVTQTNVAARLGVRSYRRSSAERLRPVVGLGARTAYTNSSTGADARTIGGYAELGAVYFATPRVSFGATGEVQASNGKQTRIGVTGSQTDLGTTVISASLMRAILSVYF